MSRGTGREGRISDSGEYVIELDEGGARAGRRWLVLPALVFGMMSWIALDAVLF